MKTLAIIALLFTTPAIAWENSHQRIKRIQPSTTYTYDYNSGNSYNTTTDSLGNTRVNGINMKTGSNWNTTIDNNGNQHGMDSNGNTWNYNSGTGTYMNHGTGKICTGHGAFRVCN